MASPYSYSSKGGGCWHSSSMRGKYRSKCLWRGRVTERQLLQLKNGNSNRTYIIGFCEDYWGNICESHTSKVLTVTETSGGECSLILPFLSLSLAFLSLHLSLIWCRSAVKIWIMNQEYLSKYFPQSRNAVTKTFSLDCKRLNY